MAFEALKARLKTIEEGNALCMYLDTLGYVTCGVGHLLANTEAAAQLVWLLPSGLQAGSDVIRAEYIAVRNMTPGQGLAYYMRRTNLRLEQATVDGLLDVDTDTMWRGLCALLPAAQESPEPAQDALLDMAFQLGPHGLVGRFPKLIAAVRAGDWSTCAAECEVKGAQPSRTETRAELFRQAAANSAGGSSL